MKRTIIINYRNMGVGGIENYIIQIIKQAKIENISIIWLSDVKPEIAPIYSEIMCDKTITRIECNTHGINWFSHAHICFDDCEKGIIISFNAYDHFRAIELTNNYNNIIRAIYITPHFTGGLMFPEDNFLLLKSMVKKLMSVSYSKWVDAKQLYYFANNHPDAIEKRYGFSIPADTRRRALEFNSREKLDINRIKRNYNRKKFIIISAGRIDFPHKGFVIGLIDTFEKLKREFPQIYLYIVGEGPSIDELNSRISNLSNDIKASIKRFPMMPPEKLVDLFKECNLNVSVAGCASLGARNGLVTTPARHYTYDCEVYGFFPESKDMTTSTKQGKPVEEYIRQVLNMTEEEYIQISADAYYSFDDNSNTLSEYFSNTNWEDSFMKKELNLFKIFYYIDKFRFTVLNRRK